MESRNQVENRGFAGAVGTDKAANLPRLNGEVIVGKQPSNRQSSGSCRIPEVRAWTTLLAFQLSLGFQDLFHIKFSKRQKSGGAIDHHKNQYQRNDNPFIHVQAAATFR